MPDKDNNPTLKIYTFQTTADWQPLTAEELAERALRNAELSTQYVFVPIQFQKRTFNSTIQDALANTANRMYQNARTYQIDPDNVKHYQLDDLVITPQTNPDNKSRRIVPLYEMQQQAEMNRAINQGMNKAGQTIFTVADMLGSTLYPVWGITSGLMHGLHSAKDIKKNGLNWNNGLGAAMGLGFTAFHTPTAYYNLERGLAAAGNNAAKARVIAREMNSSFISPTKQYPYYSPKIIDSKTSNIDDGYRTFLKFFERPSYERVNYSKYSVDATNPQERELLFKHWTSRYPNSGLKLLDNPHKISIGWDGENYLKIGEMPLSDRGKAIADVMGNRMLKYSFREGIDPLWVMTPGRTSNKGIFGFMNLLKNENTVMYMPLVLDSNIEGLSFASLPYLKINPWRHKPYQFTQIHEGLSHPTDPVVSELRTSSGNKILGDVFKDSLGATHVEGSYGKVTWPEDLYDKKLLEKIISKDSRKPTEGRAVNWEMITDLYNLLAKKKGISFEEATRLPESEFNSFVESTLDSPDKLISFMKKFDNKYLSDYADVLKIGDSKQLAAYGNRILRMIKKAPSYILPITGGGVIYLNNK